MKIRNGFVSNSSSSSFIINGVKISMDEMSKINNTKLRELGLYYEDDRDYFGDEEAEGVILGVSGGRLDDGVITKIKTLNDKEKEELLEKFKSLGVETTVDEIGTFVQYVSNDNY